MKERLILYQEGQFSWTGTEKLEKLDKSQERNPLNDEQTSPAGRTVDENKIRYGKE